MHRELAALHGMRAVHRVRHIRKEVAADGKKYFYVSVEHRVQRFDRVVARFLRRFKLKLLFQSVEKSLGRTLPDSHGAVALHVGVAAHADRARAGAPDVAADQQQIHNHRDIVDAVALLGHAQAPGNDGFLRRCVHLRGGVNLVSRQSTFFFDFFPARGFDVRLQRLETFGEGLDEFMINRRRPSVPLPLE